MQRHTEHNQQASHRMGCPGIERERTKGVHARRERNRQERHIIHVPCSFLKEGMAELERWHNKLGHQNMNIFRKCNIDKLKNTEYCLNAKMHSGEHSTKSNEHKTDLQPHTHTH